MNYEIWDFETPIKGINASDILARRDDLRKAKEDNDKVFLISEEDEVNNIAIASKLRTLLELDTNTPYQTIIEVYLEKLLSDKSQVVQEVITPEEQAIKIIMLETSLAQAEYTLMMGGLL